MKYRISNIFLHVIVSFAFLALPILDAPTPAPSSLLMFNNPYIEVDFFVHLFVVFFFYCNYFLLIPRFYFSRQYPVFILLQVAAFFLITIIPGPLSHGTDFAIIPYELEDLDRKLGIHAIVLVRHNLFLYLMALFLSMYIKINGRLRNTEREKHIAELSYLRAQINPHFLFNTLNSIYSLAVAKADSTSMAIVKLSGMMRYIIHDANKDLVSLERELTYITDYIELQKLRLGHTTNVSYNIIGNAEAEKITPLILISFIENVFKHAVNPEQDSYINIVFELKKTSRLEMKIINNKVDVSSVEISSGIGISNASKRLELLYPGKHELIIKDEEDYYSVSLILDLK